MKIVLLFMVGLWVLTGARPYAPQAGNDQTHQQWLEARYQEATSIKPGMTRADLLKLFEEAGGLQSIPASRYVLKSCSLVQIEVKFATKYGLEYRPVPDKELRITEVSRPYLERMAVD